MKGAVHIRYYGAIQSLETVRNIRTLNEWCKEHHVTTALGTTLVAEGWLKQVFGKHGCTGWAYTGPASPTHAQMDVVINKTRNYGRTKNEARRKRNENKTGRRDIQAPAVVMSYPRNTTKYVRLFWGLIKIPVR